MLVAPELELTPHVRQVLRPVLKQGRDHLHSIRPRHHGFDSVDRFVDPAADRERASNPPKENSKTA
jgi:hypothetical protein